MKFNDVVNEALSDLTDSWQKIDLKANNILSKKIQELKLEYPSKAIALRFGDLPEDEDSIGFTHLGSKYTEGGISTAGLLTVTGKQLKRENNPIGNALMEIKDRTPYIIVGDLQNHRGHNNEPLLKNIIYQEEVPAWLVIGWYEKAIGVNPGAAGRYLRFANEALSRLSPIKLYRGASKTDTGSSEVERSFSTEADFPKAFLDGDFEEVLKILRKHVGDSGFRGRGLRSYSLDKRVAKEFTFGDEDIIQELDIPVQNIVSSFRRLQSILNQPVEVKQQLLDQGLGFNVNRLSKYPYPATDPDTEQEILIYKK